MKEFLDVLQVLQETPVPNLLVIVGFLLISLAFVGKFGAFVELPKERQKWAGVIGALLLISGIGLFILPVSRPVPAPTETPVPSTNSKATITSTSTTTIEDGLNASPSSLGTLGNPLVWVLVPSGDSDSIKTGAENIAATIEKQTGLVIEVSVPSDYSHAVEEMCNGKAHFGALNAFSYVVANARGCAEVGLVSNRFGLTYYHSQLLSRKSSGIETVADLAGKSFCRPDSLSSSGWVIPSIIMRADGIDPETGLGNILDAGEHSEVVAAIYNNECDAGATYVDAREILVDSIPNIMEEVIVVTISASIPNDNISFRADISEETRRLIINAFKDLASSEEGLGILSTIYGWSGIEEIQDSFYDDWREQLDDAEIDYEDLLE